MALEHLIKEYKDSFGAELDERKARVSEFTQEELLDSLRDFGRVTLFGKSKTFSHFKNNFWYNRNQTDNEGNQVQLRDAFVEALENSDLLDRAIERTFDDIFERVNQIILNIRQRGVKGAMQMTKYDLSCYIGYYLGIDPDKVYIHMGVHDGALALKIINRKIDTVLELDEVLERCPDLATLGDAKHIENFLCVKHQQLEELAMAN